MSFLSRLFGGRGGGAGDDDGDVEARLEKVETEAKKALPGYVGTAFNRAGDLALKHGLKDRAAEYYGQAIDAFLEDGQREAARGVANKIIRVRPGATRTLCTLIWLDLGARHTATALLHLRDYVDAARNVGRQALAGDQIREMARIVPDDEFVQAAADALDILDRSRDADEVRNWAGSKGGPEAVRDPYELADACLRAAVKSNQRTERPPEEPTVAEPEPMSVAEPEPMPAPEPGPPPVEAASPPQAEVVADLDADIPEEELVEDRGEPDRGEPDDEGLDDEDSDSNDDQADAAPEPGERVAASTLDEQGAPTEVGQSGRKKKRRNKNKKKGRKRR
jgi:hypothetical protein